MDELSRRVALAVTPALVAGAAYPVMESPAPKGIGNVPMSDLFRLIGRVRFPRPPAATWR